MAVYHYRRKWPIKPNKPTTSSLVFPVFGKKTNSKVKTKRSQCKGNKSQIYNNNKAKLTDKLQQQSQRSWLKIHQQKILKFQKTENMKMLKETQMTHLVLKETHGFPFKQMHQIRTKVAHHHKNLSLLPLHTRKNISKQTPKESRQT